MMYDEKMKLGFGEKVYYEWTNIFLREIRAISCYISGSDMHVIKFSLQTL